MIAWRLTASEADVAVHALSTYAGHLRDGTYAADRWGVADLVDRLARDLRGLAAHDRRPLTAPDAHLEIEHEFRTDIGNEPGSE